MHRVRFPAENERDIYFNFAGKDPDTTNAFDGCVFSVFEATIYRVRDFSVKIK